ncbi:predicted protein [Postia placenta Mad-698-R]|nr:predicted protein [Postia placenta Mad-698-R]
MGYALWVVPAKAQRHALDRLMSFQPRDYDPGVHSSRSYAFFRPHITLVTFSTLEPPSLDSLLPPRITPIDVSFNSLKVGTTYLGSISIGILKSRELMMLHERIMHHLKIANVSTNSRSFPHMSLFYLDEAFSGERQHLAEELCRTGRLKVTSDGIELSCSLDGGRPETRAMTGFEGREIWLVECTGAVSGWRVLERKELLLLPTLRREGLIQTSTSTRTTHEDGAARGVRHREERSDEGGSRGMGNRRGRRPSGREDRNGERRAGRGEERIDEGAGFFSMIARLGAMAVLRYRSVS